MTRFAAMPFFGLALTIAGCSTLGGPTDHYSVLAPAYAPPPGQTTATSVAWELAIGTPAASHALDSTRVFVMTAPGVLETLPGARWSDPVPDLLQRLVIDAFRGSGRITGVGASSTMLHADFALALDVQRFDLDTSGGTPQASIAIHAAIEDLATNRVVAGRAFAANAPAAGTTGTAPLAAFETALAHLLPEVVDWTLATGDAERTHRSAAPRP